MLYWKIYPDLGVDLVSTLEVLANVVLLLLDRVQFFRSVDIDPADCLPQKRGALREVIKLERTSWSCRACRILDPFFSDELLLKLLIS